MEKRVARIKLSDLDFLALKTLALQSGVKLYELIDTALVHTSADMPVSSLRPFPQFEYKTLYHTSGDIVNQIAEQLNCNQSEAIYTALLNWLTYTESQKACVC